MPCKFLTLMGVSDIMVCWVLWIMIAEREIQLKNLANVLGIFILFKYLHL